jgi:phosphoglycerol transferase MdoB-like AlkP superfamily enzyme
MESYDAWPLLDKYRSLGLSEELRKLGNEGLWIKAFLPSDEFSMRFNNTVITGLPYAGIASNWQRESQRPFPSSLPEIMRQLGYRTRWFCGAPLDWQNCQHFCPTQGFDETYGSLDIVQGTNPDASVNLWAAPDDLMYQFIASKIKEDEPSFTYVFTSSYHAPYDVDLEKAGCPLKEVPADLDEAFTMPRDTHLRKLGHLWFADRCLGEFVRGMEKQVSRPLFVITGDHFGRNFINGHPTMFEKSCVPLVLYGKEVLRGIELPPGVAGGHVDIPATIIELTAPHGFRYCAFGNNLLAPQERFFGYGAGRIVGHDFIVEVDRPDALHEIPGRALPQPPPDLAELTSLFRSVCGISWWRHKRGPELPSAIPVASRDYQIELVGGVEAADERGVHRAETIPVR